MSRSHNGRYYGDSDDMVQRIRRAREAFEKKTKAFQGPDWPYYEKRVIVGQKKKEDMDPSLFQGDSVVASTSSEAVSSPSSSQPNSALKITPRKPPTKHPHGGPLTPTLAKHPPTVERPHSQQRRPAAFS